MDISFLLSGKIKSLLYKIVRVGFLLFLTTSILTVLVYRYVPVYITPLMCIRCYEQWKSGEKIHCEKEWKSIEKISPNMYHAALAAEDSKFMVHNGFDWEAIEDAYENNTHGGKKKGGSTISQQTAKNVFLWPKRTWLRKGLESYFTVLIEFAWPKKRILEVYLNIAETGDGVYGVEAAAKKYMKKSSMDLTKTEAATIAAALRSPLKSNIAHPSKKMVRYRNGIVRNMRYVETPVFNK